MWPAECDLLLVVGSDNSSNSNRLVEVARNLGTKSHLIENYRSIEPEWLEGVKTVGLTAGASAPEILVQEAVTFLRGAGFYQHARGGSDAGECALWIAAGNCGGHRRCARLVAGVRESNGRTFLPIPPKCVSARSTTSRAGSRPPSTPRGNTCSLRTREEGYWCGELGADTTLVSDYILLHGCWAPKTRRAPRSARRRSCNARIPTADGRSIDGGPSNISASVKAYFALKMAGYSPTIRSWRGPRAHLAMGGVTEVNTFTKIYLCFLGQYDYDAVPAIPPEIVLFPNWFWFNIYEISSWSRAILVPLSIAYAKKPFKKIPRRAGN